MSNTRRSKLPSNPFLKVLMVVFAIPTMLVYELCKKLSGEAYKGFIRGLLNALIALPISFFGAVAISRFLGDFTWLLWGPAAVIGFLLILFGAYPALYLFLLKPIFNAFEAFFKWSRRVADNQIKALVSGVVNALKVLPGSGKLWDFVEDKKQGNNWVTGVAAFLTGAAIVVLSGFIAYTVYNFALPYVTFSVPFLSQGLAGLAAAIPTILVGGVLFQILEKNDLHTAAWSITGAGVYALSPHTAELLAGFSLPAAAIYAVNPVIFLIGLAYLYPIVHGTFKSGLFAQLLKGVKWLIEQTYDEDDKAFKTLFSHLLNIVAAIALGALVIYGAAVYTFMPVALIYVVAAMVAFGTYVGLGEFLEEAPGNVFIGIILAAVGGWFVHSNFADTMGSIALWSSIAGSVIATFFLAFPVVYIALRFIVPNFVSKGLGGLLDTLHDKTFKLTRRVNRWWEKKVINKAFEKDDDYSKLFVHLANLALLALGVWQALPFTAVLGLPIWLSIAGLAILGYIVYLLLGKVMLGVGPGFLGFAAGIIAGFWVGFELYDFASGWVYTPVAILIGGTVFSVVTWIVFPVAYLIIKVPAELLFLTEWLKPIIEGLYNFLWKSFEGIWSKFVAVYMVVYNAVFKPVVGIIVAAFVAAKQWWDGLLGR